MERTPGSNDLLMLPSALDVDPDLGRHARRISFETQRPPVDSAKTDSEIAWVLGEKRRLSPALTGPRQLGLDLVAESTSRPGAPLSSVSANTRP
jgi:hypothetical protein